MFINPTLTLISASNDNTDTNPVFAAVPTIENIPTGPDNSFKLILPVIKYQTVKNICSTILKNLVNAYLIDDKKLCSYLPVISNPYVYPFSLLFLVYTAFGFTVTVEYVLSECFTFISNL